MHIKLINKQLHFDNYKVKCAVGKRGISKFKKEGDNCTPKGTFKFKKLLIRNDRVKNLKANIEKLLIKKNMGWCDDSKSNHYNKLIKFPFKYSAEKLYKKENIYDIILIMDYNLSPVIKKSGSAIFLHIATKNYNPTQGCVAVSKNNMRKLLKYISKKTKITI